MPIAWRIEVKYKPSIGREVWMPSRSMTYTKAKIEAIRLGALGYKVRLVNLIDAQAVSRNEVMCQSSPGRHCICDAPASCPRRARLAGEST